MKMKYLIYPILILAVLALLVGWFFALSPFLQSASGMGGGLRTVRLDGQTIRVSVADTPAAREQGLGGRTGLASDEGMLFVFPTDGKYAFWMKDMRFSIDMLWLSQDGTLVYMAQNISPDTYPQTFTSTAPARYVLELPAGYATQHQVSTGDTVEL